MQFIKLRLTGFKSFVDPTDLLIQEGLTGVVGPNGCGKSNLLEALRWVMGENRPTAMRGDGMEDVIFAGSATRPARGHAEVALQMDNSARRAPAGFNDADQLEIVRRITRDIGSAYKINGKDVRARDVQMLFADASTGAHSPALVRQGQISELINARPRARRRVLEDAAGIAGLYQRRHEAELKLDSTEANLARVDDLVGQLAGQLAQLERQARQAARYRAIGTDLRRAEGQLLWRRWQEADTALAEAEAALRQRSLVASEAERAVREAARARTEAEDALPALREEEAVAAAILQRLQVERDRARDEESRTRERIETLQGRVEQLDHDIAREAALNSDAGETVARLEFEQRELEEAGAVHDARLAAAAEAAAGAARAMQAQEAELSQMTEDVARLAARHQSATRFLEDSRAALARAEAEAENARAAMEEARAALKTAESERITAEAEQAAAQEAAKQAEATLSAAEAARAETHAREADVRAEHSEAEGELSALNAEAAALARLLERDTAEGGQIIDRLQVEQGFEKALGAALADDLRMPEVAGDGPSGWVVLPEYGAPAELPGGVTPLSRHVSVPDVLARRMAQIGLVEGDEGAALQPLLRPGQRLVSPEGDLWRWDGYRAWAEDGPSAAALRLEQINRLEEIKQQVVRATARAEAAERAHARLSTELADLTRADRDAREARRAAEARLAEAGRALSRAEADRDRAAARLESLDQALRRHTEEAEAARAQVAEADAALAALDDPEAGRARVAELRRAVDDARATMMARRAVQDEEVRKGEARRARMAQLTKEMSNWRNRLETAETHHAELADRKARAAAELQEAGAAPEHLAAGRAKTEAAIADAETRRATAADALAGGEAAQRAAVAAERDAERAAGAAREARAAAEARSEAAREARAQAEARIDEAMETTPQALLERLEIDPATLPGAEAIEAEIVRLRRQRDALGAVNLRADEDAREVQEEHDALVTEKTDLEQAIAALRAGIAGLNREGRERLLTAFEQVNANFAGLFRHLFGGGDANLVMVESDDPLEAGLEIMCQPPGKKLSTLSLLSGGEQTLTALALIFAVFLANPAPICVLDEVDAPLDDANVGRFCDLLDEMCRRTETRFLIITHHAVTMSRMHRLFGVTMGEQGVSQMVSVDLGKAAAMVA